jgi:hypothetical protein
MKLIVFMVGVALCLWHPEKAASNQHSAHGRWPLKVELERSNCCFACHRNPQG